DISSFRILSFAELRKVDKIFTPGETLRFAPRRIPSRRLWAFGIGCRSDRKPPSYEKQRRVADEPTRSRRIPAMPQRTLGWRGLVCLTVLTAITVGLGLGSSTRLTYHEAFVAQG